MKKLNKQLTKGIIPFILFMLSYTYGFTCTNPPPMCSSPTFSMPFICTPGTIEVTFSGYSTFGSTPGENCACGFNMPAGITGVIDVRIVLSGTNTLLTTELQFDPNPNTGPGFAMVNNVGGNWAGFSAALLGSTPIPSGTLIDIIFTVEVDCSFNIINAIGNTNAIGTAGATPSGVPDHHICVPDPPEYAGEDISNSNRLSHSFVAGVAKSDNINSGIVISRNIDANNSVWKKYYGGLGENKGFSIKTDELGNSVTTGIMSNAVDFDTETLISYGEQDIFIVKNDPDGNELWAKNAGSASRDSGLDIALDDAGNIYIVGYYTAEANFEGIVLPYDGIGRNAFVAKYNPDGILQWAKGFGGLAGDEANAVKVASDGSIYITGSFKETATFGNTVLTATTERSLFLSKMNSNGDFIWTQQYEGGNTSTKSQALVVDIANNIVIAGIQDEQMLLLKYASDGSLLHEKHLTSSGDFFYLRGITNAGTNGNIQVIGSFEGDIPIGDETIYNLGERDIFLGEFDSDFEVVWARGEGGASIDIGRGICNDGEGYTSYVGCTFGTSTVGGITQVGDVNPYYRRFNDEDASLPVELLSFTGMASPRGNHLKWTTASEENNSHFEVQYSRDGHFETIGKVQGRGTSSEKQDYEYLHVDYGSEICYYRLKQVDFDGRYEYSPTISISSNQEKSIELYPSSTSGMLSFTNLGEDGEGVPYQIFDGLGRTVMQGLYIVNQSHLDVSRLPKGQYYIQLDKKGKVETFRFVKI